MVPLCKPGPNFRAYPRFALIRSSTMGAPALQNRCGQPTDDKMVDVPHTLRSSVHLHPHPHPHPLPPHPPPLLLSRHPMDSGDQNAQPETNSATDKSDDEHVEGFVTFGGQVYWARTASALIRQHPDDFEVGAAQPAGTAESQPATVNPAAIFGPHPPASEYVDEAEINNREVLNATQDVAQAQGDSNREPQSQAARSVVPPTLVLASDTSSSAPSSSSRSYTKKTRSSRGRRTASSRMSSRHAPGEGSAFSLGQSASADPISTQPPPPPPTATVPAVAPPQPTVTHILTGAFSNPPRPSARPDLPTHVDPALLQHASDAGPSGAPTATSSSSSRSHSSTTRSTRSRRGASSSTTRFAPGEGPAFSLEPSAPPAQYSLPSSQSIVRSSTRRARRATPYARADPSPTPSDASAPSLPQRRRRGPRDAEALPEGIVQEWRRASEQGTWTWDGEPIPAWVRADQFWDYLLTERGVTSSWGTRDCCFEGCEEYEKRKRVESKGSNRKPWKILGPAGIKRHLEGMHLGRTAVCKGCNKSKRWDRWTSIGHIPDCPVKRRMGGVEDPLPTQQLGALPEVEAEAEMEDVEEVKEDEVKKEVKKEQQSAAELYFYGWVEPGADEPGSSSEEGDGGSDDMDEDSESDS
ncbi:hypothetical protein FKP32DRAFT_1761276 [Trametes sanguinea]|nr:hypothetical protein FKP32DRAFT_1761276 [Trametes sanguinea]